MRTPIVKSCVDIVHPDYDSLNKINSELIKRAGSLKNIEIKLGEIIRNSIDTVIDTANTSRRSISDLEKTEKTYIGTRVEILLRKFFELKKGKLDLVIVGIDVDVKFTTQDNWMIPKEAVNNHCLLVAADEENEKCYLGVFYAREEYLNGSANRDKKKTIRRSEFKNILWLVNGSNYPARFWKSVPVKSIDYIFEGKTGKDRIFRLFEAIRKTPIHRDVIEDVAQQKDYMKRLRKNGGARDASNGNFKILSGKYDSAEIKKLNLPFCDKDSFISS
jgi:hypothetical protein